MKEKLKSGDIIVLINKSFDEKEYNKQWLYMSTINKNNKRQLYPYFVVIKYYLITNIFEKNTTIPMSDNYKFIKIPYELATLSVQDTSNIYNSFI